jgi:hypothetical protein
MVSWCAKFNEFSCFQGDHMNEDKTCKDIDTVILKKNRFIKIPNEQNKFSSYKIESDCIFDGEH